MGFAASYCCHSQQGRNLRNRSSPQAELNVGYRKCSCLSPSRNCSWRPDCSDRTLLNLRIRITGGSIVKEIPSLRAKLELQVLLDIEALEERKLTLLNPGRWIDFRRDVQLGSRIFHQSCLNGCADLVCLYAWIDWNLLPHSTPRLLAFSMLEP
jgi:hypothetical protein